MRFISAALVASGLVIVTGPLCLQAHAQDYVDVEAERAAEAARATVTTPAGTQPATSYGVNNAPAATVAVSPAGLAGGSAGAGQNLGNLFYQIQQLQQEVMRLNGIVEEQTHELRKLKEQSLERYIDLDKRLSAAGAGTATTAADPVAAGTTAVVTTPPTGNNAGQATEQLGEGDAYRAAYALVRGQQFEPAVQAFQQFLRDYPDGKFAPNAHYWLGELYLVVQPQDLESSRQSFMLLINGYPDNNKVPDALFKLGKVHFLKGNREKAREFLDRVIRDYGSTNSSAVKLARDFIDQNY